jgi:arylsulfatase A-like enzyme
VAALDRNGLARNTLLIVTSDNGAHWLPDEIEMHHHRANGNVRGQKADIYDGGHRIPFMARWPGKIKAGRVSNQLACLTDLMATVAEITGAKLPAGAGEDSYSLVPALLESKPQTAVREAIVHHSSQGLFAIRQGPWKLALGRGSGGFTQPVSITPKAGEPEGELYNLADDPLEKNNLYATKPDIVLKLTALLDSYKRNGRSRS